MIEIKNKKDCCGCEACVQACAKQCISFQQDSQGFFYPVVDKDNCVNCGLCDKVCPIINVENYHLPQTTPVYAAYNINDEQRKTSSSGGIFELLANNIISKKGVVFGALFDEEWNVVHGYAEDAGHIEALKRSKYVQSRIGESFKLTKKFLHEGRMVMFVGTPCQISGLKHYLRKEYENLITVDVVCHGVPSPSIWKKYLSEIRREIRLSHNLESENNVSITNISFRDKIESWRRFHFSFTYQLKINGIDAIDPDSIFETKSQYIWENDYMLSFLKDYANRPSCFDCKFRDGKCRSDLTLADFWGIQRLSNNEDLIGEKGTSLVMVHTSKGREIFENIDCYKELFDFRKSFVGNPAVFKSWPKPISHGYFFRSCIRHNIRTSYNKANTIQIKYQNIVKPINRIINKIKRVWQRLV